MNPKIIPGAYGEYDDGRLGAVAAALANIELKIGEADAGAFNMVYTFSGSSAKEQARIIFEGGPLLEAVLQAFNAGSSTVYAIRAGNPGVKASKILTGNSEVDDAILLTAKEAGVDGNDITIEVSNNYLLSLTAGFLVLDSTASPNTLRQKDETGATITDPPLSPVTLETEIDGKCAAWIGYVSPIRYFVAGIDTTDSNKPKIWVYEDGVVAPTKTIDLSGLLAVAEEPRDFVAIIETATPGEYVLTLFSQTHYYVFPNTDLAPVTGNPGVSRQSLVSLGISSPDIIGGGFYQPPAGGWSRILATDNTAKKLYEFPITINMHLLPLIDTYDFSLMIPSLTVQGFFIDSYNEECYFNFADGDPEGAHVTDYPTGDLTLSDIKRTVDYGGAGDDCQNDSAEYFVAETVYGLGIIGRDTGETPAVEKIYTGSSGSGTGCEELVAAITADGTAFIEAALILEIDDDLDNVDPEENMTGGSTSIPTNQEFIDAMEISTNKTEVSWTHLVNARTAALWAAVLAHCDEMLATYNSERFAILETPLFVTTAAEGTPEYLTDLQTYVESLLTLMTVVANRNAVVFPGGAEILDSESNKNVFPITAVCGGTMANLEVQKSLINKNVKTILSLVPKFSTAQIQQLIQARMNPIILKPGRGYVIAHSLTGAATGSDFSRANDLRAVYYGGSAARAAAQPLVGEENDEEGEGLAKLAAAMSRPLEVMRDGGQIDDFLLELRSTAADRLLGDVYCELGIQPLRAMEMIYITVYLT